MLLSVLRCGLRRSGGQQREPQTWECIRVRGKVAPDAEAFVLSLGTDGNSLCLHFSPRFKIHRDVNNTVCDNSKNAGMRGKEHREPVFPFQPGGDAEVCITFNKAELAIKLPGGYTFKFLNLETIDYMGAEVEFKVKCVTFG